MVNRNRPRFESELSCLRSIGLVSKCDEPFAQRDADKFACRHWTDDAAHRAQSIISVSMFAGWCEREELELSPNGHAFLDLNFFESLDSSTFLSLLSLIFQTTPAQNVLIFVLLLEIFR